MKKCPQCDTEREFRHLYSTVHGIAGTHMEGSERFECIACGLSIYAHSPESNSFKFVLDKALHK